MQLQMTAPLDIGLEQSDLSLKMGQEEIFDLTDTRRGLHKIGGIARLIGDEEMSEGQDDDESEREEEGDMDGIWDSDQERERKLSALEVELDGMYDAYQEKLNERNSKRRVQEARRKSGLLEEWNGIGSTNKDSDDESSQDGGWEKMDAQKEMDDSSSSEEESDDGLVIGQKRLRPAPADPPPNKKVKFIDDPSQHAPRPSRAAQVWFSRDVFEGLDGDDMIDEDHESDNIELASPQIQSRQVITSSSSSIFTFDPSTVR